MSDTAKDAPAGINPDEALNRDPDFDTAPVVQKDGSVILSQAIRDEQKAQGFVPDIQPKSAPSVPDEVEFDPTKTQATSNAIVAHVLGEGGGAGSTKDSK